MAEISISFIVLQQNQKCFYDHSIESFWKSDGKKKTMSMFHLFVIIIHFYGKIIKKLCYKRSLFSLTRLKFPSYTRIDYVVRSIKMSHVTCRNLLLQTMCAKSNTRRLEGVLIYRVRDLARQTCIRTVLKFYIFILKNS